MAFLAFEGIDGSGKSSLISLLQAQLKKRGQDFILTKEPGGTPAGEKVRELLLAKKNFALNPLSESLLFYADRKQNIEEVIRPALEKGQWVLSDRYYASTSAYQCGGKGMDPAFIQLLKQKICGSCEPDLWILLDLPVAEAFKRLPSKKTKTREDQLPLLSHYSLKKGLRDRMEKERPAFYQRVRDYYLKMAKAYSEKWLILNALHPPEELLEKILSHLKEQKFL